jgi:hypothetical protein
MAAVETGLMCLLGIIDMRWTSFTLKSRTRFVGLTTATARDGQIKLSTAPFKETRCTKSTPPSRFEKNDHQLALTPHLDNPAGRCEYNRQPFVAHNQGKRSWCRNANRHRSHTLPITSHISIIMSPVRIASRAAPLVSVLLLLSTKASSSDSEVEEASSRRHLGDVSSLVSNNKWLEFDTNSTIDSLAFPCSTGCSSAASSLALGSTTEPWTYTSASCTQLTVLQGYDTGDSIYQVLDGNTVLGNTTQGSAGTACTSDPTVCFADAKAGRLQTTLAKGTHSIRIQVKLQTTASDGGWFMINTTACPPSKAPTKAPTKTPTKVPTKSPNTSPTKAPTKKPTKSPSATNSPSDIKCISKLNCAKLIRNDKLCGCKKAIAGNKDCVKKKAKNKCCPVGRDKNYVALVYKKFVRLCTKGIGSG